MTMMICGLMVVVGALMGACALRILQEIAAEIEALQEEGLDKG